MYAMLAVSAFFLVLTVVAYRCEKRMVWPFGSIQAQPQFSDTGGYGARCVDDALKAGFRLLGWAPDLRAPRYKISYALLVSSDGDCFAVVGVGTLLSMRMRGTWLYTRTIDGRVFYTTDSQVCVETDVSRMWRSHLAQVDTFSKLWQRHRDLLRDYGVTSHAFSAGREAEEFRNAREEHFQAISRLGLIAFVDGSATHWRYTLQGALKAAVLNFSIGLLRRITFGRVPRSA